MSLFSFTPLPDRSVIRIGGDEAHHFLQNLVTCDMDKVQETGTGFGALLTPQGKIQFDFFLIACDGGFLLDTSAEVAEDLLKRLTFYRLRAKVTLEAAADLGVLVSFGDAPPTPAHGITVADPRLSALGLRHYGDPAQISAALQDAEGTPVSPDDYRVHRIECAIPESLVDYSFSEIFPHDADMDQLNGVSFSKGCYVGQEVVSRMQHRSTARKRMIAVTSATPLPGAGTDILADDKSVGYLTSTIHGAEGNRGIALVRLDKAQAAREKGADFLCGDTPVTLSIPSWAAFDWPVPDETA